MIRTKPASFAIGIVCAALPVAASAQIFTDNFNTDSSANYAIHSASDTAPVFAFDYSTVGIPSAPNSTDDSTLGLRTVVNGSSNASQTILFVPNVSVSGDFKMGFDIWMNYNGPLNGGGTGSTEFAIAGVGADTGALTTSGAPTNGLWFAAMGDGFGSFRIYHNTNGAPTTLNVQPATVYEAGTSVAANYPEFPGGATAPLVQGSNQTGETGAGALGFQWHRMEIERIGDTVTWSIDDLLIATIASAPTSGPIFFGHWDHASSVANPDYQFNVIDNLVVIPEPSTYAMLAGLGFLGFAVWRRSRKQTAA